MERKEDSSRTEMEAQDARGVESRAIIELLLAQVLRSQILV